MSQPEEVPLSGGNVGVGVVRVGDTVRRPAGFWSASVHALLRHLNEVGYAGAPRTLGFDEHGRHVLSYVKGDVLTSPPDVRQVGVLIRDFHDASAEFTPPPDARWNVVIAPDAEDLVVHHDLAPWNFVVGRGVGARSVFIDWDNAGPGSRLWDLAYAAHGFAALAPGTPVAVSAQRLAALADGYRLDQAGREELSGLLVRRILSMYDLLRSGHETGTEPWARLWRQGHGVTWLAHARHTEQHLSVLMAGLTGSA